MYEAGIRGEQVEEFDLIGHVTNQKRNLVFSPFQSLKILFLAKEVSKFETSRI